MHIYTLYSIGLHTAVVLMSTQPGTDATCSLSTQSRFKQSLQSCDPLTPPIMPCLEVLLLYHYG